MRRELLAVSSILSRNGFGVKLKGTVGLQKQHGTDLRLLVSTLPGDYLIGYWNPASVCHWILTSTVGHEAKHVETNCIENVI